MRAARLHEYGHPLTIDDVAMPEPGPGEVLVKVEGAGVCHSDLHVFDGRLKLVPELPWILGHENAGRIEALGVGVSGLERGEPVAVFGGWGCGRCRFCLGGEEHQCDLMRWVGHGYPGGYAEYLLVPSARHLVPIFDLDPIEAAPLTDAALTPYRAVKRSLRYIAPNGAVLLIGLGGLGYFGLQVLRFMSPTRVAVVETSPKKRDLALELGAQASFDPSDPDLDRQVAAFARGDGYDAVFDFVGVNSTLALAVGSVGRNGRVVLVGLGGGSFPLTFKSMPLEAGVVTSSWGNRNELVEVIDLARRGLLVARVERYPLTRINEAVERLRSGAVDGRAVVLPNDG